MEKSKDKVSNMQSAHKYRYLLSGKDVKILCANFKEAEELSNQLLDGAETLRAALSLDHKPTYKLGGSEKSGWHVLVHAKGRALRTLEVESAVQKALGQTVN